MQKIEFGTLATSNGVLYLPQDKLSEPKEGEKIHVVDYSAFNNPKARENEQWNQLGIQSFFKDHSDEDNIYDELHANK